MACIESRALTSPCSRRAAARREPRGRSSSRGPRLKGIVVRPPVPAMATRVVIGAVLLFSAGACLSGETSSRRQEVYPASAASASTDAIAIYGAVLGDFAKGRNVHHLELQASSEPVRIRTQPFGADHREHALFQALLAAPSGETTIASLSRPDLEVTLLSDAEVRQLCSSDEGWADFYTCFPDSHGLTTLSAIGFDPPRERAMVVVSLPSSSIAYVLERTGVEWRIANQYWLRVSIG
jgi:hypothetical protein